MRPYLRLARIDRPIGWWLLLLPCWWSTAAAAIADGEAVPNLWHLALFFVGAVAMRGAGSTYNDVVDRELDAKVSRTRMRPLPSGQVTVRQALLFLGGLALLGLLVLTQFNGFTIVLGCASLAIVAIYPYMKRVTSMPQFVLGLAFSWGALMGWAATFGSLDWPALLLYVAAVSWTVAYDTIYAVQDLEDDAIAGIKSSARLFAEHTQLAVGLLFALTVFSVFAALPIIGAGVAAYLGLTGFAIHLAWQVLSIDTQDPQRALALFRSNRDAGLILFAGLSLDALISSL